MENAAERALVVGASGIVGNALARHLLASGWQVWGLARRPPSDIEALGPVAADLLDPSALRAALYGVRPTHVFISAWLRQPTEAENIRVNSATVRNVLGALGPGQSVTHVALVTGLKHYLGPFEAYGKGTLPATPFREEQARLDVANF
jgi:nucleoside-diphosphate-sugar epimerase